MKINWKVRFSNPHFIVQIILALFAPILAYFGLVGADLTSWSILGETLLKAISSPYVCSLIVISVWNAIQDPTTQGISDSYRALTYDKPVR